MTPLIARPAYEDWTEEEVWGVFLSILTKDSPLPGLDTVLQDYRQHFHSVYEQVRWEHRFLRARFYQSAAGRPIVNPLHLEHITRLLHYFSNALYRTAEVAQTVLDCLFYVMRSRCGINLFYRQELKSFFMPRHAIGSVFGYGDWGRFLYFTQNCTIGVNNDRYPTIGDGLIMGPGSTILGDCAIGSNVRLAAGTLLVDKDVPDNTLVLGRTPQIEFRPNPTDNIDENVFKSKLLNLQEI